MDRYVILVMHHAGKFVRHPTLTYVDGEEDAWDWVDIDKVSIPTITQLFCEHGYHCFTSCWYLVPGLDLEDGLRPLNGDMDVIGMYGDVEGVDEIELYFEHPVIEHPDVVEPILSLPYHTQGTSIWEDVGNHNSDTETTGQDVCAESGGPNSEGDAEMQQTDEDDDYLSYLSRDVRQEETYGSPHDAADQRVVSGDEEPNRTDHERGSQDQNPSDSESDESDEDQESSDAYLYYSDEEEQPEQPPYKAPPIVDSSDEEDVQQEVERVHKTPIFGAGTSGNVGHATKVSGKKKQRSPPHIYVNPFDGQGYETEDVHTPDSSETEGGNSQEAEVFPQYNPNSEFGQVNIELGMEFPTLQAFKEAVKDYTIHLGRPVVWVKNDKKRAKARCIDGCMWEIFCSFSNVTHSFQVKKFIKTHTCSRKISNRQANSRWLAHKLLEEVRGFPSMECVDAQNLVKRKYNVNVNDRTIFRALRKARKMVEGTEAEQYAALWDYCDEIKRVDPRGTVQLAVDRPQGAIVPNFDRLYICLDACKVGFKAACRPLIGLDGCFLKGYYGGILLAAVAQDGNNSFYPIAYAVVDLETKDTWRWFLTRLLEDLGNATEHGWNFISDQQKGLEPALAELCPTAPHRSCAMHIWKNFCKTWKSKELRSRVFLAAKSSTMQEFDRHMAHIRMVDDDAYKWLTRNAPSRWVRGAFSTYSKNQAITSNMCEQFNKEIRKFRSKPILNMLEEIRCYIMRKRGEMLLRIRKYKSQLVPMAVDYLETEKKRSSEWCPLWAGDPAGHKYEVSRGPTDKVVVDLSARTCSCRTWDLTGIPCRHACAAFASNNEDPDNAVNAFYLTSTWVKAYEPFIEPLAGQDYWKKTNLGDINPPPFKRPAGRPKKNRSKINDVPQDSSRLKRKYGAIKCSKCGRTGHNTRTCKGAEPRKRGKKSKRPATQPHQQGQLPVSQPLDSQVPPPAQESEAELPQRKKKISQTNSKHGSRQHNRVAANKETVTPDTIQAATRATRNRFSEYLSAQPSRKGKEKLLTDV